MKYLSCLVLGAAALAAFAASPARAQEKVLTLIFVPSAWFAPWLRCLEGELLGEML